jgi:hypothetical protein
MSAGQAGIFFLLQYAPHHGSLAIAATSLQLCDFFNKKFIDTAALNLYI